MNYETFVASVAKLIATAMILAAILCAIVITMVAVPILIAVRGNRSHSKTRLAVSELIPLATLSVALVRLWSVPKVKHAVHPGFDGVGRRKRPSKRDYDEIPF